MKRIDGNYYRSCTVKLIQRIVTEERYSKDTAWKNGNVYFNIQPLIDVRVFSSSLLIGLYK